MKILFVTFYDVRCTGLRILASCLKNAGYDVHICFIKEYSGNFVNSFEDKKHFSYQEITNKGYFITQADTNPISFEEDELFLEFVKELKPDIVAFSLRDYLKNITVDFLEKIKASLSNVSLIVGGYGPTMTPEFYTPYVDAVCRGEGEEALVEFCNAIEKKESFYNIENLSYMLNGKNIHNPLRRPSTNISEYPWTYSFFDGDDKFTLIDNNKLILGDPFKNWQSYCFLLGRGCLGTCSYCSGGDWVTKYHEAGHKIPRRRLRDIDDAIAELKRAKEYGYKRVHFTDEYFAASREYLNEFLDKYEQEINLPIEMYLHYMLIINNPDILKRLAKLQLKKVCLGIQSGCEDFARDVYNRKTSHKDLLEFTNLVKSEGIAINIHIIIGNPLESEESFRKTLNFLKQIPYDPAKDDLTAFRFTPFPNSPIVNKYGEMVTKPVEQKIFERQGCLAQLRVLLSDEEFFPLLNDETYITQPHLLKEKYYALNNIKI